MSGENRPLAGKRVAVTRAPEQAGELAAHLEGYGAEVLLLPTVGFADPKDTQTLDAALRALDRIDWIVFTSENAVRFFAKRARVLGLEPGKLPAKPQIAAVGPATAGAAEAEGFAAGYVAKKHRGESLANELREKLSGKRVLLPRSDLATDELPRMLSEFAGQVIEAVAYRTVAPGMEEPAAVGRIRGSEEPEDPAGRTLRRIRDAEVDIITFASPSAFRNFTELIGTETLRRISESAKIAAIGPTTARAVQEDGYRVAIEAKEATSRGLAEAIAVYFEEESSGVKSS
ncbi:MAG TPA: uroporphyrinogen-III synthase [Candidatus Acidoferrales bacterium]|nr:uroporphyrinogen-III synthase [Candidatus Acidoferrales bacterium]